MKRSTQLLGAVSASALIAMSSTPALAVGTNAGNSITNNVTVTFEVGDEPQTEVTASDTFTVDRRIDVNVNFNGVSPTSVSPGEDDVVLAFDVTNLSNATVDLDLSAILTGGTGDAGDISAFEIYIDADGDGQLDADEITAGTVTFLDEVAADDGSGTETISVLVVTDISLDAINTNTFDVALVADAHEAGTAGALGANIDNDDGANTDGVDTVLADGNGGTGEEIDGDGAFSDEAQILVAGANITVVKSSSIISDPVNNTTNPKAIPGAVIQYCIAVSNASGAATASAVNVADDLPADVTFTENDFGIFVNATATVDDQGTASTADDVATCTVPSGTDGEASGDATFTATGGTGGLDLISGDLLDIAAGETRAVYFRVTIN
ncbi:possible Bacterial Ig-like domain (group 1) protein [Erythrobacter sp. NAP1]|uniref:hypothetical protein n=1 Tax=Erythrobacter sp. NAP1 TaxID=237727 RepID=UPI0000686BD8|nr:hypothetical protein [Erythrobacter sp. NAP1]EAQ29869.1 possible Bacterial Ig-like domain (group 1) protein [Erythrobacter sp. NAP1]